jgi:hypothetical protein
MHTTVVEVRVSAAGGVVDLPIRELHATLVMRCEGLGFYVSVDYFLDKVESTTMLA